MGYIKLAFAYGALLSILFAIIELSLYLIMALTGVTWLELLRFPLYGMVLFFIGRSIKDKQIQKHFLICVGIIFGHISLFLFIATIIEVNYWLTTVFIVTWGLITSVILFKTAKVTRHAYPTVSSFFYSGFLLFVAIFILIGIRLLLSGLGVITM